MKGRYQMILTPCDATLKEAWGKILGAANSILELWDKVGWRGEGLSWKQQIEVVDTKTGKRMSEQEYGDLVRKLKGW